jgi:hypothetical protein
MDSFQLLVKLYIWNYHQAMLNGLKDQILYQLLQVTAILIREVQILPIHVYIFQNVF